MNPYGDPQSARARARVPGPSAASPPEDEPGRLAPDAYRRSAGNGTSGRASVGSVPVAGSARVGGRAPVGAGTGAVGGRAAVARAAVRPGPGPGYETPGGPVRPGGGQPSKGTNKILSKVAKRRRRTNILTAFAAVVVILLGAGVVGGAYFFDDVEVPLAKTELQGNVILDSKGGVLAKSGEQNRIIVPETEINKVVEHAVAAAEDKNFYTHNGIDMKGIARAAWNNFTGGDTQGASTITQQYARHAADLKDISYNRKLREAVIARKLESQYDKDEIMGKYLNYIYLGEGRYGIEAAAKGYFNKSVTTPAGKPGAVTPYEAAVLASIIKQPEAGPPGTHQGYDPNINPVAAKERWEYTMKNMLEMNWITRAEYDARKYPVAQKPGANACKTCAVNKPSDMIIRHVQAELKTMGFADNAYTRGGLTITTTIDPKVQKAAEEAGSVKSKESPLYNRRCSLKACKTPGPNGAPAPTGYQAAVIGIDPNNGRVLGYYGGDDATGLDYAGYMNGNGTGLAGAGQSPGSSFKIYTLAAGLKEDISFKTTWDGSLRRLNGTKINNADSPDNLICRGEIKNCDLETATIKSYNFPFYWITVKIGVPKVLEAAKAAGIKTIFNNDLKPIPLNTTTAATWTKSGNIDNEVGFGQYHVIPLEHAEGVATIVNGGVHHAAHFIKSVKQVDPETGKVTVKGNENQAGNRVFSADQMANLDGVLAKIVKADNVDLRNGRESVGKSGTWEYDGGSGDCWFVGGVPQLAATVWVGSNLNGKFKLKERSGKDMFGAGTPAQIWKKFIDTATAAFDGDKHWDKADFPERVLTGNDNSSFQNGQKPAPSETPNQGGCLFGVIGPGCDGTSTGNNNGQGTGNDNGGNNNGQGTGNNGGQTPGQPGATLPPTGQGGTDGGGAGGIPQPPNGG